jgi:hypothetical protein
MEIVFLRELSPSKRAIETNYILPRYSFLDLDERMPIRSCPCGAIQSMAGVAEQNAFDQEIEGFKFERRRTHRPHVAMSVPVPTSPTSSASLHGVIELQNRTAHVKPSRPLNRSL